MGVQMCGLGMKLEAQFTGIFDSYNKVYMADMVARCRILSLTVPGGCTLEGMCPSPQ